MAPTKSVMEDAEFFLEFLGRSEELRDSWWADDMEVMANYMVMPWNDGRGCGDNYGSNISKMLSRPVLKDTESHQIINSLLAKTLLGTLSGEGFVKAMPVGREDAAGAAIASSLVRRMFRINGNFRNMYVGSQDAFLFGATVYAPRWMFLTGPKIQTRIGTDEFTGQPTFEKRTVEGVLVDDIDLIPIDLAHFFPEPDVDTVAKMLFAAYRYSMPRFKIEEMAESGQWNKAAVGRALEKGPNNLVTKDPQGRQGIDRPMSATVSAYENFVVIEGWGETPHLHPDKSRRRRIIMINEEVVSSKPSPIAFSRTSPFFDFVVNPIAGRWRGIAPGHLIRHHQDLSDAVLMLLAEGVQRKAAPPLIYDANDFDLEIEKLIAWRGPIAASNINGVKEMNYNPEMGEAFQLFGGNKQMMREGTAATSGNQGFGLGSKRFSASEAQLSFQNAGDRPQMTQQLWERVFYPDLAKAGLELYAQFLQTPEDLADRVGGDKALRGMVFDPDMFDIDYDFEFVGSSQIQGKEIRFQLLERAMQLAVNIPGVAPLFPWQPAFMELLELADLRELEQMYGKPEMINQYLSASFASAQAQAGPQPGPNESPGPNAEDQLQAGPAASGGGFPAPQLTGGAVSGAA